MIDFVKCRLFGVSKYRLLRNTKIQWNRTKNLVTRKTESLVGFYKGLKIEFLGNYIYLSGSLHKAFFFNENLSEGENYSDFSMVDLVSMLVQIQSDLKINPHCCVVENLEFAVNIEMDDVPLYHVINSFVSHQGVVFSNRYSQDRMVTATECLHEQYSIKPYIKSLFGHNDLFRFELKYKRTNPLNKVKVDGGYIPFYQGKQILTLGQVFEPEFVDLMKGNIKRVLTETVFYDGRLLDLAGDYDDSLDTVIYLGNPKWWSEDAQFIEVKRKKSMVREYQAVYNRYIKPNLKKKLVKAIDSKLDVMAQGIDIVTGYFKCPEKVTPFNRSISTIDWDYLRFIAFELSCSLRALLKKKRKR